MRKPYKTDLTDEQWNIIKPLIPPAMPGGRPREVNMREVLNTLLYQARTGCQWELLPHDLLPKSTVSDYFAQWRDDGTWRRIVDALRGKVRTAAGREPTPRVGYIDSQTVKATEVGGVRGYDGGKRIDGRKRHMVVDSLGLLLVVLVTAASADDGANAPGLLGQLDRKRFPRLEVIWGDGKYRNDDLDAWLERSRAPFRVEVVRRPAGSEEFVKLPKRWVSERTFAWRGGVGIGGTARATSGIRSRARRGSRSAPSARWCGGWRRTRIGSKPHSCTSEKPPCSFPDSLCVDEKPNCQVLERRPIQRSIPGSIEQREFEYARHGTVNILVFLIVHSGRMEAACVEAKNAKHYTEELAKFRRRHRHLRGAYLIHDGDPSHTATMTEDYLSEGGGWWRSRLTPVHASWLDQAELVLDAFAYRYLKRGSWCSRSEFIEHVGHSWPEYNRLYAHPFEWTWTNQKMRRWFADHEP